MLSGHKGNVRCVKWIESNSLLASCCASGGVILWQRSDSGYVKRGELCHESPCLAFDCTLDESSKILTVVSTRDFKLHVYSECSPLFSFDIGFYALTVKVLAKNSSSPLVFYAGDDCTVRVGVIDQQSKFNELLKLTGHTNWIRSIDLAVEEEKILLLSASQDHHARLWSLKCTTGANNELNLESSLETVLSGHEDSLTAACITKNRPRRILTASLDRTVVLWSEPETFDQVWSESARVGEVGGNNPGFLGCTFDGTSEENRFSAYSFNGALHFWKKSTGEPEYWETQRTFGGHYDRVTSISWEPSGNYLISASADETTRIHLCSKDENSDENWLEFARPQVHGYEINCVCAIDELTFVSGADEKVIRVFQATQDFVDRYDRLNGHKLVSSILKDKLSLTSVQPALGLTNRAVYEAEGDTQGTNVTCKTILPREEDLMQNTLFAELSKLYGHGNEIFALAVNHKATIIASACKAAKPQQAGLILWSIGQEFKVLQTLSGHQLTVTSIKFSPDDKYLLSVSRDRTWFLYALEGSEYVLKANTNKDNGIHKRIIWDAAWTPDGEYFCTVSRDKIALMWQLDELDKVIAKPVANQILTLEHSIGCCDIHTSKVHGRYLVALGTEDGTLNLYSWDMQTSWSLVHTFSPHQSSVSRLAFKPMAREGEFLHIASASDDKSVQVHRVTLHT